MKMMFDKCGLKRGQGMKELHCNYKKFVVHVSTVN